eukprot:1526401-Amphidinium_carterae.1
MMFHPFVIGKCKVTQAARKPQLPVWLAHNISESSMCGVGKQFTESPYSPWRLNYTFSSYLQCGAFLMPFLATRGCLL